MAQFRISVSPNPTTAATPSATNATSSTTAAPVVLFNPLVNPRLVCSVTLPRIALTAYRGGSIKLLADFASIVASNAALEGPAWVQTSLTSSTPVTINTTVSQVPVADVHSHGAACCCPSCCTAAAV